MKICMALAVAFCLAVRGLALAAGPQGDIEHSLPPEYALAQQPTTPQNRTPGTTLPRPTVPPSRILQPDANVLALGNSAMNYTGVPSRSPGYGLATTQNMIGDTLGVGYFFVVESAIGAKGRIAGNVPIGDSSVKISEDCSPLPVDRVFFDYNHFHNALLTANGGTISLNRYTFGFEKTFYDGNASLELKAPIEGGLNEVQFLTGSTADNEGTIFGTLAITPKVLLFKRDNWAMSGGLAIGLPTSPDAELNSSPNTTFRVFDDSVHLAPFLGLLLQPNDHWFSISYLQLDFDANGNRVTSDAIPEGRLRDPTLMYVDCSVGYWLFYDPPSQSGGQYLTGVAPIVELHYTTTLQNAEGVGTIIRPASPRVDVLNITGGLFFKIGPTAGLTVGAVAPLRTRPSDKEFDAEVLVQFNRWF